MLQRINNGCSRATQEVEIRAWVPGAEANLLAHGLIGMEAVPLGTVTIDDVYFCPKEATRFEDVEMNAAGSYCLRVRRQAGDDGRPQISINSKTLISHGDHRAWEEHEVEAGDFEEAKSVFTCTGFKPYFSLSKRRQMFALSGATVCLEDIDGLDGIVVEIERMTVPGGEEEAKLNSLHLMRRIGIAEAHILEKSITNRLMRGRAVF